MLRWQTKRGSHGDKKVWMDSGGNRFPLDTYSRQLEQGHWGWRVWTHTLREWTSGCPEERWEEGIVREFGMDLCTLLYLKWITNKDLLNSTGTLLSVLWQPGWEGSLGENGYMYMYGWIPSLFIWNYHNIVNQLCVRACVLSHFSRVWLFANPVDCSPPGSSVHGDSPCKNTGVGSWGLLQGIFLTQGSNPHLHLLY